MKYWQKACIWLTRKNIYVLKTQRSWYGTVQSRQACMYTCQSEWMRGSSYAETLIHQLVKTYGLQSYRIAVLVGDTALIWKKLAVPSKKKKKPVKWLFGMKHWVMAAACIPLICR